MNIHNRPFNAWYGPWNPTYPCWNLAPRMSAFLFMSYLINFFITISICFLSWHVITHLKMGHHQLDIMELVTPYGSFFLQSHNFQIRRYFGITFWHSLLDFLKSIFETFLKLVLLPILKFQIVTLRFGLVM